MTHVIKWDKLSFDEKALSIFLQGVLNRKKEKVYIDVENYINYLDNDYNYVDLYELIKLTSKYFGGIVTYKLDCEDIGINMASMICAKYDYLGVPDKLLEKVISISNLKVVRNMNDIKGSRAYRQKIIFDEVKNKLNRTGLVHQVVSKNNFLIVLRDFAIKNRFACIYTSENEEDLEFRKEVLSFLKPVSPIYGWNDNEISFIKCISQYGHYALPSDWCSNQSYFEIKSKKIYKQQTKKSLIKNNKHYLAIVVSDGDNIQWLSRDFTTTSTFGCRERSKLDYKITWTISPSIYKLCPNVLDVVYGSGKSNYFISSVSGIGYANLMSFPERYLKKYCKFTTDAMKKMDLDVVCLLDNIQDIKNDDNVKNRLKYYAKNDKIIGGIWEIDPDRYSSGNGKIFYVNNKPFVSVRYSLWCPFAKVGFTPKSFLDEYVEKLNSLKPNINSEEGYTVLNFHPWSISIDDLEYVLSKLNSDIELVYADELIKLINQNVKRKE